MIAVIAAYTENRVIGCRGKIPWKITSEQSRFRRLTTGNAVIMGRKTYEEIGKPLLGRYTVLVSSTLNIQSENCTTVKSFVEAIKAANGRDIFVSGGQQLYRQALPLADVLYLTKLHTNIEGDRFFPEFDENLFDKRYEEYIDGEIPYTYTTLVRKPMKYENAVRYVSDIQKNSGIILGLQPLRELLSRLGNPQDKVKFIHIAGTNGKGSVGAMLSSILTHAGFKTGHFSSPAVFSPLECWRIDGKNISQSDYAGRITRIAALRDQMQREGLGLPTAFEIETALAFLTFYEEKVDIAVLECGMGGADDATNVINTTVLSLITSIGLDHTKFLGSTLSEITAAKCGIIKNNIPTVVQAQSAEAENVIKNICRDKNSRLVFSQPDKIRHICDGLDKTVFGYKNIEYTLSLCGSFQLYNAAQVIEAVDVLRSSGYSIGAQAVREGLSNTVWNGRMQKICGNPVIMIDGAHNPNAALRLRETVLSWQSSGWGGKLYIILGVLADKDFSEVCGIITPLAEYVFTVTPNNPRALSAQKLAECAGVFCKASAMSMKDAVHTAVNKAQAQDRILICGSLSFLNDIQNEVRNVCGGQQ